MAEKKLGKEREGMVLKEAREWGTQGEKKGRENE